MEKTVKIGDREILFAANASVILIYHQNFGTDYFRDIATIISGLNKPSIKPLEGLRTDLMCQVIWTFAKCANKNTPPIEKWLAGFELDDFDIQTVFNEMSPLILRNNETSKKKSEKAQGNPSIHQD